MPEILKPNFNNGLWASGGAIVAPSNTKIATGWTAEVPPFQWENYTQNRQDQGIAHILQHGISVWDALTEYQGNKSYVTGSDGVIYRSVQTNTNQNPVTDTAHTYWEKSFQKGSLLNIQVFDTPGAGTYTKTPGTTNIFVDVQGAGGQGGGSPATAAGQISFGTGGHSGSRAIVQIDVTALSTVPVVVGAGGSTGTAGNAGQTGGTSSFGAFVSCPGGAGGGILGPTTSAFIGGNSVALPQPTISGVVKTIQSQSGNSGVPLICINIGVAVSGSGGTSPGYGGAVTGAAGTQNGNPGTQVGSGGTGALSAVSSPAQIGGLGIRGKIIVYEYS